MCWELSPQSNCLGVVERRRRGSVELAVPPGMDECHCHRSGLLFLEVSCLSKFEPSPHPLAFSYGTVHQEMPLLDAEP